MSDATGKVAVYDWGADGLKRKVSVEGDANSGFSYLGSVVYTPNGSSSYAIESVAFPEGRFVKTTSGYEVQYQVKDHLGSVRATVNANGVVANKSDYYPFGDRWSSSGEATTNRYLFSGKEKQTAGNLQGMNLLDFGARMYDPEIPRWLTNDPLAEKYFTQSPYVYCANNPVKYIDPDGVDHKLVYNKANKTVTVKANYYYTASNSDNARSSMGFWNKQKTYHMKDGETYNVNFDLNGVEVDTDEKAVSSANADEIGNSYVLGTPKSKPKAENTQVAGETINGKHIVVHPSQATTSTSPHEIGHTLGIRNHSESGIMTSSKSSPKRSNKVIPTDIKQIMHNNIDNKIKKTVNDLIDKAAKL